VVVGIIWNGERFLIQKRLPKGHLGGLWEFPGGKVEEGEELSTALCREVAEETGLIIKLGRTIGKIEHAYSHFSISLHAYHCRLNGSSTPLQIEDRRWIAPEQIADFPFPKANHKLFNLLNEQGWRQ
ncbi:MAG: (deoxy)nucleoside triphosphate pyrophosphohydrolase, partial [Candidatus Marinimicrobia bacterium]|nr:(deoxy)nucleoside triphosphate pyrophosphohydrolase [Candidatus Neomarinimicrobiota bacterium]